MSALACDISEFLTRLGYAPTRESPGLTVAYHAACSLQHGQSIRDEPKALLRQAGFRVVEPNEPHLCCGSAGTYNLLQPAIAERLRARKLDNLRATQPGPDRGRQYRLHHATVRRRIAGGAHRRIARLDGGRTETRCSRLMLALAPPVARRCGMRRLALALAVCLLPIIAHADALAERRATVNKLLNALKAAPNPQVAAVLEVQIEQIWLNQSTPAVTLLMTRGLRELKAEAANDAIEDFGDAIVLDPTLAEAYLQRAMARWQSGDTNGAIADIEATLKRDPRHFTAFETLSRIAEARKDWKGAYDAWQQLLTLDPQTPDGQDRLKELKRKAFGQET